VINRSIDEGILKEFLLANTPEVRNMLFTKWNWDDYIAVKREEDAEQIRRIQEENRQFQEESRQFQEEIRRLKEENRRLQDGRGSGEHSLR
jgi:predicted nuclease with TOPRIM domain